MTRCLLTVASTLTWFLPIGLLAQDSAIARSAVPQSVQDTQGSNSSADQSKSAAAWRKQLMTWRAGIVGRPNLDPECIAAREAMLAVDDPTAVSPTIAFVKRETDTRMKWLCWQVLANLGGDKAIETLVDASVFDSDASMRTFVAELVATMPNAQTAITKYARYLRNDATAIRAAKSISETGLVTRNSTSEPLNKQLVYALIDALKVEVRQVISTERPRRGHGFGIGDTSYSMSWTDSPKYIIVEITNQAALQTLSHYVKENFGYDQKTWIRAMSRRHDFDE
jgi:hypothetical protein